jgi:hypothetical protein
LSNISFKFPWLSSSRVQASGAETGVVPVFEVWCAESL